MLRLDLECGRTTVRLLATDVNIWTWTLSERRRRRYSTEVNAHCDSSILDQRFMVPFQRSAAALHTAQEVVTRDLSNGEPFVPDASDVRINAYWYLVLIISVSGLLIVYPVFTHPFLRSLQQLLQLRVALTVPRSHNLPTRSSPTRGSLTSTCAGNKPNVSWDLVWKYLPLSSPHFSVSIIVAASLSAATITSVGVALLSDLVHAYVSGYQTIAMLSRSISTLPRNIRSLHFYMQS